VSDVVVGIEMTVLAVVYVAFSIFVQRKLVNMKRLYETQNLIQVKSKELNELAKNKADSEVMLAKQKEITTLLSQSMKSQFKPMFVILPIFVVVYYLIFPVAYPSNPNVTLLSYTLNYRNYFIVVAFVLGLLFSIGLMINDRLKMSREKKAAQAQAPGPEQ
jgi:uncharacterized membrane protein (DUF106 family)